MRVFDLIYRVKELRVPCIWLVLVLSGTLIGWCVAGCRVEYRTATDGTYVAWQAGPPAGPLDPDPPEQEP